jgi:excisionase family DNA binding protein
MSLVSPEPQGSPPPQLLHNIEDAAQRVGVGRTTIYSLIRSGDLRTVSIGRRRLVAEADLRSFVDRLRSGGDQ